MGVTSVILDQIMDELEIKKEMVDKVKNLIDNVGIQ